MLIREFTYGDTACLVEVAGETGASGETCCAALYVVENRGRALRRVGDGEGAPVELRASSKEEALNRAAAYLYERFGPLAKAQMARRVERSVRPINEPPLKDERPEV